MSTNWLLNDLAEAKGKQELYTRQSPQLLKALREMALVQSVESFVARFEVCRANRVPWSRTGCKMAKEGNTLKRG